MNKKLLLSLVSVPLSGWAGFGQTGGNDRPNIIMFLVDDMGWQDTSVPFWERRTASNDKFETPNMERLDRKSVV